MTLPSRTFLVGFVLLVCQAIASANEFTGRVVGVLDGDTIEVLTEKKELHRVRLIGIDAPEKRQAFGEVSKRAMSDLSFDKTVTVFYKKRDRYGRVIGLARRDGTDLSLALVRKGLAWHYKKYQSEQSPKDRTLYDNAEVQARSGKLGLWLDKDPIAPWSFRKQSRKQQP